MTSSGNIRRMNLIKVLLFMFAVYQKTNINTETTENILWYLSFAHYYNSKKAFIKSQ